VPRPERPLDASSGPVQQFATDLRRLRADCGSPPYREMARVSHFSKATLSAAAAGYRLPTWDVTSAYVRACGGDPEEWRLRWQDARTELGLPADRLPTVRVAPKETEEQPRPGRPRRFRLWFIAPIAVAVVVLIMAILWADGPAETAGRPPGKSVASQGAPPVRYQGGSQPVADNNDPKKTGCAFDPAVTTLDAVEIDTSAENYLGIAELRYSPLCQVAWGRFTPSSRMAYLRNATITIVASRPASHTRGTLFGVAFDGQAAFGNILSTRPGCIEITVTVRAPTGGGAATTKCER
jgi:hypothetical protein